MSLAKEILFQLALGNSYSQGEFPFSQSWNFSSNILPENWAAGGSCYLPGFIQPFFAASTSSSQPSAARLIGFALTWPPYLDKRLDMYPTFDRILRRMDAMDAMHAVGPWGGER